MDKLLTMYFRHEPMTSTDRRYAQCWLDRVCTNWQRCVLADFYVIGKEYTFKKYGIDYNFLVNLGVLENELC